MNPKIFFGELKRRNALTQLAVTPFFLPYVEDQRFVALCLKLNVQVPSVPVRK